MVHAVRFDEWTSTHDKILGDAVIQQVRNGGTQLQAFAVAGHAISRTKAACGFRWNSVVRKDYSKALMEAKIEKELKRDDDKRALRLHALDIPSAYPASINSKNIFLSSDSPIWIKYVIEGTDTYIKIVGRPEPEDVL